MGFYWVSALFWILIIVYILTLIYGLFKRSWIWMVISGITIIPVVWFFMQYQNVENI